MRVKESLIKGAAIDYAARKSVTERGDNRFNQRFLKVIISAVVMIFFYFLCFALCQTELLWIIQPLSVISGGFCGVLCGDKKASRTALCSICVLALFTLTIFIFGRLGIYDFIMLGGKPSEDNYLSASNMGAAGLILILLYSHSAGGYLFGAVASCLVKKGEGEEG